MPVGTDGRTFAEVVKETMRLCGLIENEGTYTAGTTTTGTDATNERVPTAQANSLVGQFLFFWEGTGVGDYHEISSYGTIGVHTWAVAGTAPTTTTKWVRTRINPQRVIDAIDEATRKARSEQAIEFQDESLITNNLLDYFGTMEHWDDGAAVAPEGWTAGGAGVAVARQGTTVAQGTYSARVTAGGGAVGTLTRTISTELNDLIKGQTLHLLGMINEAVAADLTVRVAVTKTDGTAATGSPLDITGTLASNIWQEIEDFATRSIAIPDPVASVAVSTRSALSAVTYVDDLWLGGPTLRNYLLPRVAIGIGDTIEMESGYRSRRYTTKLYYGSDWEVRRRGYPDGTSAYREIHFFSHVPLPSARHLRMTLYREPDVVTATSNVETEPAWLAHKAAVRVVEQQKISDDNLNRLTIIRSSLADMERSPQGKPHRSKPIHWFETR